MSKYLLNKFLFTVDRDAELVERYRDDPRGTVEWWEAEQANRILNCPGGESSTWLRFDEAEREALADPRLPGAVRDGCAPVPHPDALHRHVRARPCEPLGFQLEYARRLAHFSLPYPDIAT